ncbi:MAG: hypothetical protein WAK91_09280 [Candidatus Acidiferrales bacterium]|jgi:hypothetical protein
MNFSQPSNLRTIQLLSVALIRAVMIRVATPVVSRTLTRLSKPETISQLRRVNVSRGAGILPANWC